LLPEKYRGGGTFLSLDISLVINLLDDARQFIMHWY